MVLLPTYICSFILYLQDMVLVNMKLDISGLQISLVELFSDAAKMKLANLAFFHCDDFVKNLNDTERYFRTS